MPSGRWKTHTPPRRRRRRACGVPDGAANQGGSVQPRQGEVGVEFLRQALCRRAFRYKIVAISRQGELLPGLDNPLGLGGPSGSRERLESVSLQLVGVSTVQRPVKLHDPHPR